MSPEGFDSSGFIGYVYKENGISLPRVSFDIYDKGKPISKDELLPGDLIFFEGYRPGPSHGTLYIGNNKIIHSPTEGKTVSISTITDTNYWGKQFYGAIRYIEENE